MHTIQTTLAAQHSAGSRVLSQGLVTDQEAAAHCCHQASRQTASWENTLLHHASPGEDHSSKFKVWFRASMCGFHIIGKIRNLKFKCWECSSAHRNLALNSCPSYHAQSWGFHFPAPQKPGVVYVPAILALGR